MRIRHDISGWQVRWSDKLADDAARQGLWPDRTIAELARDLAQAEPERVLIREHGLTLTCRQIYTDALKLASYLVDTGLKSGDTISFQLPNWNEANIINLAAAMLGIVVNPIVPIFRESEVSAILEETGSKLIFIPTEFRNFDYIGLMDRVSARMGRAFPRVLVRSAPQRGHPAFSDIIAQYDELPDLPSVDPNAVKLIMYTSGTTGRPKGVLHTHNTIHAENVKTIRSIGLSSADCMYNASPVTHVTGALYALNLPWFANIPIVLADQWEPQLAFAQMRDHRCTYMAGATPFLQGLIEVARPQKEPLPDLRAFTCGGAAVPPSLIYEAKEVFPGCRTWKAFGATEIPTLTVVPTGPEELRHSAETDGRIWLADVKVIGLSDGLDLADGAEGEIVARAPNMAVGYARQEDNDGAYDQDGYFRTGDIGRIVEGHIRVTGRIKDLIIRAGENISAKEVEDILFEDPGIKEIAIVAMPSERTGEAVCAFIVPVPGQEIDLPYVSRIVANAGLARQKTPEFVKLLEELPKTAAGKIRKDVLRSIATTFARQ